MATGLVEIFVFSICVNGLSGCTEATSAYTKQSKDYQAVAATVDKFSRRITDQHRWLVYVGSPVYSMALKKPVNIAVYRGTTISMYPWNDTFYLKWNY